MSVSVLIDGTLASISAMFLIGTITDAALLAQYFAAESVVAFSVHLRSGKLKST